MTGSPPFLRVLLEGPTEQAVHDQVLRPHWEEQGWYVKGSILITRPPAGSGSACRGGVSSWARLEREIRRALAVRHFSVVTTVLDYYGLPADSPGMRDRPPTATPRERVEHVERSWVEHFDDRRLVPHLTLHELETWVFAAGDHVADLAGDSRLAGTLLRDVRAAGGAEAVDDGPTTAPSKRLASYWPAYDKTVDGPIAIAELGLPALRDQCPHLDAWLVEIERRVSER